MRRLKRIIKILYFRSLCSLLYPDSYSFAPYAKSPVKYQITKLIPAKNKSAVRLFVYGKVTGVGFRAWVGRKAKSSGLYGWARNRNKKTLEILLIGDGPKIELLVPRIWKGPTRANVVKIKQYWFNKPARQYNNVVYGQVDYKMIVQPIKTALNYLQPIMKQLNTFAEDESLNDSVELKKCAVENNLICYEELYKESFLQSPERRVGFSHSEPSKISSLTHAMADNKSITTNFLAKAGFPVPMEKVFTDYNRAKDYFTTMGKSAVLKPIIGTQGKGITVGVKTVQAFDNAWHLAKSFGEQVVVQEFFEGIDIRIITSGGKAQAAMLRIPAHVVGDGTTSIERLIDKKNIERSKNPRLAKKALVIDEFVVDNLKQQGFSYKSIPEKNEIVFLHLKANIGAGGDSVCITEIIDSDLLLLAEEVSVAFGADFCGVDMMVERLDLSRSKQCYCILEVNTRAALRGVQFPMYGKPVRLTEKLLDNLFPGEKYDHLYPVVSYHVNFWGWVTPEFLKWVLCKAEELGIDGYIQQEGNTAEGIISGYLIHVIKLLDELWGSQENWYVDGLEISDYKGEEVDAGFKAKYIFTEETKKSTKHVVKSKITLASEPIRFNSFEKANDLESQLFLNEFACKGYAAEHLSNGIFKIKKNDLIGFICKYYSSLFADKVCRRVLSRKKILSYAGLKVPRGRRFTVKELDGAVEYLRLLGNKAILTGLRPDNRDRWIVHTEDDLKAVCKTIRKSGGKYYYLEEFVDGWKVSIAVINRQAESALLAYPITFTGNGKSKLIDLVERRNSLRKGNPYYMEKLIPINEFLSAGEYHINDIVPKGEEVSLDNTRVSSIYKEYVNIDPLLHPDFSTIAVNAVNAIPDLEFAIVNMILPNPAKPAVNQRWVVSNIDSQPTVAQFHFPMQGKQFNLARRVVENLCLTERSKWIYNSQ